jgi:probable rRNA maturation factor
MPVSLAYVIDDDIAHMLSVRRRQKLRLACLRMLRAVAHQERRSRAVMKLPALEMSLRLTSDAVIKQLNHRYRHKNKPTDVLAFAQRDAVVMESHFMLGDVVISVETAQRQSKSPGRAPQMFDELLFLASHGLCHLIGYDHQTDDQEFTMNARMANLRHEALRTGRLKPA